jgi:hypothetical protein
MVIQLSDTCRSCRYFLTYKHDDIDGLQWALHNILGLSQVARSWEVSLSAAKPDDDRTHTVVIHDTGRVEDPAFRYERDGLPGILSATALEKVWKISKDPRFHPMNHRWAHPSYHIKTLEKFYRFHPEKYTLPVFRVPGTRLWTPSVAVPKGRPRLKPLKKSRQKLSAELRLFESREYNLPLACKAPEARNVVHCSSCGKQGHTSLPFAHY